MITRLILPDEIEAELRAWMGTVGIPLADKNVVISRAVEIYIQERASSDEELMKKVEARRAERSARGKEIWRGR